MHESSFYEKIIERGIFMENTSENRKKKPAPEPSKRLVAGILAHVDAGKTTLAEGILYSSGSIRKWGRVDHKDAFLDTYALERARGITIFSKQARFTLRDREITLLDTPGHVDFSAEMERTLQVLDYAILVISGTDGVQGHVRTLWNLLERYQIPVFLFINKMDLPGADREAVLKELRQRLDDRCVDFAADQDRDVFFENAAVCGEDLLEEYLETGVICEESIQTAVKERRMFPCFFGAALKMEGVEEFLQGFYRYSVCPSYPSQFGARVYKIGRDERGNRLTYMKITGGSLHVKDLLTNKKEGAEEETEIWEEKADQIRIYSGVQYEAVSEAPAGTICAVTGLTRTKSGEGLGVEEGWKEPYLAPVLNYRIQLPQGTEYAETDVRKSGGSVNVHEFLMKLRQLEEEEPQLHIVWKEGVGEIHVQVMGEVQIEILKSMIQERYGLDVEFDSGSIVYKETIADSVEGVGHFEPLRHYAEVHLLMEPGERGSGLVFSSSVSEDVLDRNWQRLILTHLMERSHPGVLTGSEITDMKITLAAGRAHLKHTEGGDFRQATYRAIRQGLRKAQSILLEPVYEFSLEIPSSLVGRALSDIQRMYGSFEPPIPEGEMTLINGTAPVVTMRAYPMEVAAYSQGMGHLSCMVKGYEPCHNADEVMESIGYDADADVENPCGSVFCSHGAGFYVPWNQVEQYMHLESVLSKAVKEPEVRSAALPRQVSSHVDDKELEEIFLRTYGPSKRDQNRFQRNRGILGDTMKVQKKRKEKPKEEEDEPGREYLLVDGYNIIFSWEELKDLARINVEAARGKLMDILSNYQGYKNCTLILVFDAYKVERGQGEVMKYHNIYVIYTKEAETADQYIEKAVHEIAKKHHVTVATSDALEQVIIWAQGAKRMSAKGLLEDVERISKEIRAEFLNKPKKGKSYLFDHLPRELNDVMEEIRLGRKKETGSSK